MTAVGLASLVVPGASSCPGARHPTTCELQPAGQIESIGDVAPICVTLPANSNFSAAEPG